MLVSGTNLVNLHSLNNHNLLCIKVYNVTYANSQICDGSNDGNWCKDETAIYSEDCVLGISAVALSEAVSLFPNPIKNTLQINSSENITINRIEIYDALGRKVLISV